MKRRLVIVTVVIAAIAVASTITYRRAFAAWPIPPGLDNMGLWVKGEPAPVPSDWSFLDGLRTIRVETQTWYKIPYSVEGDIIRVGQQPYLLSHYFAPKPGQPDTRDLFPAQRVWNRNVVRDPRVRLAAGGHVYELAAYHVTDEEEIKACEQAFQDKYGGGRGASAGRRRPRANTGNREGGSEAQRGKVHFLRLVPRQRS
jgi:hypothetical protein